jgi:hypothetical protein
VFSAPDAIAHQDFRLLDLWIWKLHT